MIILSRHETTVSHILCALFRCGHIMNFWYIYMIHLSLGVASLGLGLWWVCFVSKKGITKGMHKIVMYQTIAKHNKARTICLFFGERGICTRRWTWWCRIVSKEWIVWRHHSWRAQTLIIITFIVEYLYFVIDDKYICWQIITQSQLFHTLTVSFYKILKVWILCRAYCWKTEKTHTFKYL